jgi:hypothetical protein
MDERGFKGVWMCASVYLADDLTPIEKLMLVEIDSLTTPDCACYASNDHFASLLRITESRANHLLSGLAKKGYVIRVGFNGRTTYRVVAPQFSANPKTSSLLIEQGRQSRVAKNNNPELLQKTRQGCQKRQVRPAKNDKQRIPIENTSREHETTTIGNAVPGGGDNRLCSSSSSPLVEELGRVYGLSKSQRDAVASFIGSHGEDYVRAKWEIVRSQPRRNGAGALLAALRDDWQMAASHPQSNGPPDKHGRLAAAEARGRERGWTW